MQNEDCEIKEQAVEIEIESQSQQLKGDTESS
jgi:hypothetical protein